MTEVRRGVVVLRLAGTLNDRTYQQVRDAVINVAVDAAAPVIVDVNGLDGGDDGAWVVFTSARWHVKQWPEVPIALVSGDPAVRARLADLSDYVPVYADVPAAAAAIGDGTRRYRHRARESFDAHPASVNAALISVHEHLVAWSMRDKIPVACTVTTVFAENALSHTGGGFDLRLEGAGNELVVAVSDSSRASAVRRERPAGRCPGGLDIVSSLCGRWGNTPAPSGKTVWARIGPADTSAGSGGPSRRPAPQAASWKISPSA